ncbi:putative ATP-dependent RNA helicase DHX57 [Nasonia vitripennis]|uniref:Uncharacterized protein n=1 Tax=Nasonia vitripennis TaxID=7425 RepID=A0A7M7QJQ9_NASVI|nr:putative ATP-dependent RNA helicase DHX57 [Nasonia vitripennis]
MLLTKDNEILSIHPSSVNFNVANFSSSFLAFEEKIEKSKIFIKEVTLVPMLPLVLFSSHGIDIEFNDGQCLLSLDDGWVTFAVKSLKVAQLLQLARAELSDVLEKKMRDPQLNLFDYLRGKKIINTIVNIISIC